MKPTLNPFTRWAPPTKTPKIALFDIETAPSLGYFWGKLYETSIIGVEAPWYMLSFAYKWLGERPIYTRALCDYPLYEANLDNDYYLVKDLWKVLDEADIVIAHNGDKFDIRKTNARFIKYGMKPPSPYKSIDTLKAARKHFQFESNRLNDLGQYFGLGGKLPNTGFDLWKRTMQGDRTAWDLMKKYNRRDIVLLEQVYEILRPYMATHPNLNIYNNTLNCTACQSPHIQRRGTMVSQTQKYHRYHCQECGHWSKGPNVKSQWVFNGRL